MTKAEVQAGRKSIVRADTSAYEAFSDLSDQTPSQQRSAVLFSSIFPCLKLLGDTGWIATRATGQFSSRYGGIEDLAIALRVVLPTGEIVNTRSTPRAAIGPDLKHVFMGAEGTMGVIVEVTLRIFPLTAYRRFEALRFPGVEAGVTAMRQITRAGLKPSILR